MLFSRLVALSDWVGRTFAVWVLLFAFISYLMPQYFTALAPLIPFLLGLVMFGMGLTLKPADFAEVLRRPLAVLCGVLGQFTIMPLLAYALCQLFSLPAELAIGVILVGCCPGGTASNVMTYLARGDVSLSVTITACTTLLAPFVTPALIYLCAREWVEVSALAMFMSIVRIVLLPIAAGVLLNVFIPAAIRRSTALLPLISVVAIVAIVCAVVAVSHASLAATVPTLFLVVVLHNGLGYLIGFILSRMLRFSPARCKALSLEIGMQNSGLGVALAMAHFTPVSAVPSALFSVWHNLSGPLIATLFRHFLNDRDEQ